MDNNLKPKLLIVEDDPENQKLLNVYLRRKFEIVMCDSDEDFYKKINLDKYDIFLIDISLRGEKNGLELIQELRKDKTYSKAPIVCISAHVFPADRENAFKAGVDEFLPRPVFNQTLLNALKEVYHKRTGKVLD